MNAPCAVLLPPPALTHPPFHPHTQAVRCSQLGATVVVVMEQPEEVELAIAAAALAPPAALPVLGIRAKLATAHGGHWGTTSGDRAKFGLSARQIVAAVRRLAAARTRVAQVRAALLKQLEQYGGVPGGGTVAAAADAAAAAAVAATAGGVAAGGGEAPVG